VLTLECGEDAQIKNSEILPFVSATDSSREEERCNNNSLVSEVKRAVKGRED